MHGTKASGAAALHRSSRSISMVKTQQGQQHGTEAARGAAAVWHRSSNGSIMIQKQQKQQVQKQQWKQHDTEAAAF